jgi:hypothetical protein
VLQGAVDVVGGELWALHCGGCELHDGAYLVVGEGVCLRHGGGGLRGLLGLVEVLAVVQSAWMHWWMQADDGAWRLKFHGPSSSGRRLATAPGATGVH